MIEQSKVGLLVMLNVGGNEDGDKKWEKKVWDVVKVTYLAVLDAV